MKTISIKYEQLTYNKPSENLYLDRETVQKMGATIETLSEIVVYGKQKMITFIYDERLSNKNMKVFTPKEWQKVPGGLWLIIFKK